MDADFSMNDFLLLLLLLLFFELTNHKISQKYTVLHPIGIEGKCT